MAIPKRLFFIWLGNTYSKYVLFSINAFKQINPDYEIVFLHYTIDKIKTIYYDKTFETIYDKLLFSAISNIFNNKYKDHLYRFMVDNNLKLYGKDLRFLQVLSDIYRLELLNNIGGIYLDCDTFPIKPFDEELLNKNQFIVEKHVNLGFRSMLDPDNYFIGCNADNTKQITKNNNDFVFKLPQTTDKWWSNIKFLINKKKFFNCELKIGDYSLSKDFYIEHYCDGNWKNLPICGIRTPKCFLDDLYQKHESKVDIR